jgi:hypothetical protein
MPVDGRDGRTAIGFAVRHQFATAGESSLMAHRGRDPWTTPGMASTVGACTQACIATINLEAAVNAQGSQAMQPRAATSALCHARRRATNSRYPYFSVGIPHISDAGCPRLPHRAVVDFYVLMLLRGFFLSLAVEWLLSSSGPDERLRGVANGSPGAIATKKWWNNKKSPRALNNATFRKGDL